jgi:uncharacterized protein YndB with AHSA1/START domain
MTASAQYDLTVTRLIDVPRAKLWRCWTEPQLICRWFTPPPWVTISAEMDIRPGGLSLVVMRGPDGTEVPNPGIFLEVVPERKLVFTDAYGKDWAPSANPFMTAIITFDDEDGQTRYTARARHWTAEAMESHQKMGFEAGWGVATDQLAALARTL